MRKTRFLFLGLALSLVGLGCLRSLDFIKAKGRVVKGGQPYLAEEGQGMRIFFAPLEVPAGSQYDSYAAVYDPKNGTFEVTGKDGKGLPRGRYRVDIQLMKNKEDLLNGKLMGANSPLTLEVKGTSDELVIDLDQVPFDKLLAAGQAKLSGKR
jgi:hypothetical protein